MIVYEPTSSKRVIISIAIALAISVTDFVDGKLARKYNVTSELGYLLDGLGDRAFHVSIYLILFMFHVLNILVAWALIFREIAQYAVRLIERDWHSTQSKLDRKVTRAYTVIVQALILSEFFRVLAVPQAEPTTAYITVVNLSLVGLVVVSYSRIIPRLLRAWRNAVNA